jgi:hypothetical protein
LSLGGAAFLKKSAHRVRYEARLELYAGQCSFVCSSNGGGGGTVFHFIKQESIECTQAASAIASRSVFI